MLPKESEKTGNEAKELWKHVKFAKAQQKRKNFQTPLKLESEVRGCKDLRLVKDQL